jgi:hypothetical protein
MVDESCQLSEHFDYIYYTTFSVVYQNIPYSSKRVYKVSTLSLIHSQNKSYNSDASPGSCSVSVTHPSSSLFVYSDWNDHCLAYFQNWV